MAKVRAYGADATLKPNFRSAFEDMLIHQGFIGRKCV
jgi:hypothetical protein